MHPSVAAFARSLLAGTFVSYDGDPLRDLTLTAFLDKFVQRKPKACSCSALFPFGNCVFGQGCAMYTKACSHSALPLHQCILAFWLIHNCHGWECVFAFRVVGL